MQHVELLQQGDMIEDIDASLIKNEMFELAGDLSLQRKNSSKAIQYYTRGKYY